MYIRTCQLGNKYFLLPIFFQESDSVYFLDKIFRVRHEHLRTNQKIYFFMKNLSFYLSKYVHTYLSFMKKESE